MGGRLTARLAWFPERTPMGGSGGDQGGSGRWRKQEGPERVNRKGRSRETRSSQGRSEGQDLRAVALRGDRPNGGQVEARRPGGPRPWPWGWEQGSPSPRLMTGLLPEQRERSPWARRCVGPGAEHRVSPTCPDKLPVKSPGFTFSPGFKSCLYPYQLGDPGQAA